MSPQICRFAPRLLLLVLALALVPSPGWGQTGLASVTGIVTDSSGAAVPGVTVTATNQATNVPYTGVTSQAGAYIITAVPIGAYVVKVELEGFKAVQSTVTLSAGQTARIDFGLDVGTVTENVEVVATGAVLQTENAVVGSRRSINGGSSVCRYRDETFPPPLCTRRA